MAQLTREQIADYARAGGFTGDDINIAVAVALAESGGDTKSHNTKAPDNSYGLWQINMYGSLGPDRRRTYNLSSNDVLFDPTVNAKVAAGIKRGSGWGAWTTYTSGKYKEHLSKTDDGKGFLDGFREGVSDGLSDASGVDLSGVSSSIDAVGKNIFNSVASTATIGIGLGLLILGVVILLRKPIGNAVPVKKLAKAVKK